MSKIDLKIRPVTKNDTLELIPVVRSYIVDFYKCPDPTDNELENHINYLVDNPGSGKQFLMEKNGEIIGFATLYFTFIRYLCLISVSGRLHLKRKIRRRCPRKSAHLG